MSESKLKKDIADRPITFDFNGPKFSLTKSDRKGLGRYLDEVLNEQGLPVIDENGRPKSELKYDEGRVTQQACKVTIKRLIDVKWPPAVHDQFGRVTKEATNMSRKDGQRWRIWRPCMDESVLEETAIDMQVKDFDWLLDLLKSESIDMGSDFVGFREDLVEYMEETRAKLFLSSEEPPLALVNKREKPTPAEDSAE